MPNREPVCTRDGQEAFPDAEYQGVVIDRKLLWNHEGFRNSEQSAVCRGENRMTGISNDSKPASQAKTILLVEDSFANRDMLTRRLQRRGFTVCCAPDGPTGVAMSVSEKPDVILMDVALGEMDGWQATRLIKADVRTSNIPIIALTAHALASDREKSVEVGCADFDTKPVDLTRLLGKIQGCLTRAAVHQAQFHHHGYVAHQEHVEGVRCYVDN
ncbi:MAG TPA: response regulator [Burkholderiaceae bacterium]